MINKELLKEFYNILEQYKKVNIPINLQEEELKKYEYVYYSNKLEGNKLDLSQTTALLKDNIIIGNKASYIDVLEAKGHYKALNFIIGAALNKYPLSVKIVKQANKLLLHNLWNDPDNYYSSWKAEGQILGECKIKDNKILYDFKGKKDIIIPESNKDNAEENLSKLVEKINKSSKHVLEKASELAYQLFLNQFFPDDNKRTARLMATFITMREKLPLTAFNKVKKENFNEVLLKSYFDKNTSVLTNYIAKNLIIEMHQELEKVKSVNKNNQNKLSF
jgi:Fic family protein